MFLNIFLVLATVWLTLWAFNWSGKWGINAIVKCIFIGLALYGILVTCKLVIHV